ncbi:MAG: ribosome silencing factor [Bacteroidetes bacterium]|nr:ribosome silencing factor [Bacteroidota bacterium]
MPRKKKQPADILADAIIKGIQEKKGVDPILLNMKNLPNAICDTFIICHGKSTTQVEALADSVIFTVKKTTGELPWQREGFANAEWILIDYVNVVVHIFLEDRRNYYNLEQLWSDAEKTVITSR